MKKRPQNNDNGFEEWGGYMGAKISKLEEQYHESTKKNNIFKKSNLFEGISIFVNGYTKPSADELKRIMMANGGIYHHYKRSSTTYIIAENLPDVKIRSITSNKIIRPDWIVDSLKEMKILDYSKYLLYTNEKISQPKLFFTETKNEKSINTNIETNKKNNFTNIMKEIEYLNDKMQNNLSTLNKNIQVDEIENEKPADNVQEDNDSDLDNLRFVVSSEDESQSSPKKLTTSIGTEKSKITLQSTLPPSVPKQQCRTAIDPNFLSDFYNNSRLHHISTLGAGFKKYITELRESHDGVFPGREKLRIKFPGIPIEKISSSVVMHIDMDCFFVSVGLRTRPHLRGKPVAVTHSKGADAGQRTAREGVNRQSEIELCKKRLKEKYNDDNDPQFQNYFEIIEEHNSMSEIASCSYEARKMGIKNGMFVGTALKLCPNLKTIPYDFASYKEVAFSLYNTISEYTIDIEAVSCDEMFVDLTSLLNDVNVSVEDFVGHVRKEIRDKTECPCSAGMGENRLQARLATKKAKPDGQFYLEKLHVNDFMKNILISDLPGVGFSTTKRLLHFHWQTCGDLKNISLALLQREFGKKFGETLYQFSRGIDTRPFIFEQIRKSVSVDVNYGIRFKEISEVNTFLSQLCAEIHNRLMEIKRKGKCITLKLMVRAKDAPKETSKFMGHGICDYVNKSITLSDFTCDLTVIEKNVLVLYRNLSVEPAELRGIGIQITKLDVEKKFDESNVIKKMFEKVQTGNKLRSISPEPSTNLPSSVSPCSSSSSTLTTNPLPINKSENLVKQPNRSNKILELFKKSASTSKDLNDEIYNDLDQQVLFELPDEIRNEVIRDYRYNKQQLQQQEKSKKSESTIDNQKLCVDMEFLEALPFKLRVELEKEIAAQPDKFTVKIEEPPQMHIEKEKTFDEKFIDENLFLKADWRNLLKLWIDSSNAPIYSDINLIGEHAKDLIKTKQWDDLYIKLRYLHRIIDDSHSCGWHSAYYKIINIVQNEFICMNKPKLSVKQEFNCKNNFCKNLNV